ncbi:cell wall integrity and stress response component 1-like [Mizuhopecten yessoensis]|uniref:Uncharacterized protein n=1 Tax=Mizuhopecten yessoensis TaxID=6573 RepID=A0A210R1C9_MIZYE|nr:cell wall integrity and stress response component 1-like [Mizuhopecten yessoensis]OWF54802.1 hypothetical protein KP79_PYT06591 [Mizuhopecten yessoensis]
MAVQGIISVWTYSLLFCVLHLYIKGVVCSECTDLARILEVPVVSPCQPTASHVTGSGVVFDFYESNNLVVDSCSCSITIPSTTDFTLSMSAYQGLGIDINSGCGSRIEVNSSRSGSQVMECRVFGSIAMKAGENAAVTLFKEQNGDARYCMLMSTAPSFIMDINCEAVGSPPTTTTKTTTNPMTTTTTTPLPPTTTEPTTTTTTEPTTTKPTTTTPTSTSLITTTTPTSTTVTTTLAVASQPITTTAKTATTTTKQVTKTTKPPTTTTTKPPTTTTTKPPTTTQPLVTTVQSSSPTTSPLLSSSTAISTTTTTTAGAGTNEGGQGENSGNDNLMIIIPVVVGFFLLLLLLVVVTQLVRTKKKQTKDPDMEKFRFGHTFPKHSVFLHSTGMVENTKYDSKEDLHRYSDRYISVTNPVYNHGEAEHLPDLTDQQVTDFTHNSEPDKIISEITLNDTEVNNEAPLYAVVNKTNTNISLDLSKMSDFSSNSSSEVNSIGMLEENERNLRHEETFHY